MPLRLIRSALAVALAALLAPSTAPAADLTPTETRWLAGAAPVLAFARESGLPLDIVVQPQPTPGAAPLALAYLNGRCKLVLSMRGNAEAEATLARVEPDLLDAALELMAAHELGHCHRHVDGAWYRLPAGFSVGDAEGVPADLRTAWLEMQAVRREEAYGDLVGLAWSRAHHPRRFERLHGWLMAERSRDRIPGSHHDTLAWLRIGKDIARAEGPAIFDKAAELWTAGLELDE